MTLSPEVQAILDRVKAGEPELTAAEKRARRKAERPAKPKPPKKIRQPAAVGPHGSWRPALPADLQQAIVEEYKDGAHIKGIAEAHGINNETVRNCLKWHDVWQPGRRVKVRELCPITLLALWEQGLSVHAISLQVGASQWTVADRLRGLGVETVHRQAGGRPARTVCDKGHQKALGAKCHECTKARQRAYAARKYAEKKAAASAAA